MALGIALRAIGVAHANRHFVGKLAVTRIVQRSASIGQRNTFEQDILIEAAEFRCASLIRKRLGQTANLIAFAVVLVTVRKGGQQGDGEDGFLLCEVHFRDSL